MRNDSAEMGYLCSSVFPGKKGPQAHPALRNRQPHGKLSACWSPHHPACFPCGDGPYTGRVPLVRAPPLPAVLTLFSLLKTGSRPCTPHSSQGRPGRLWALCSCREPASQAPKSTLFKQSERGLEKNFQTQGISEGVSLLKTKSKERWASSAIQKLLAADRPGSRQCS